MQITRQSASRPNSPWCTPRHWMYRLTAVAVVAVCLHSGLPIAAPLVPHPPDVAPSSLQNVAIGLQQQSNRTLVIIMGNLRGGEIAWKTLYENVLDLNSADLALIVGRRHDTSAARKSSSLYGRAAHIWEFDEYDDWGDAVDLVNGTAWRQTVPRLTYKWSSILGGVRMHHYNGSGAVILMIRWFLCQQLLRHPHILQSYDRFVLTRSDHYYLCAHNLSLLDPQYLWLPAGQDNRGITDRHLIVNAADLLLALDILPPLLQHPEQYATVLGKQSGNPEKVILQRWKELGLHKRVRRFERNMFTCAATGDPTRWKTMTDDIVPEGVHLKYLKEYNASHATCHKNGKKLQRR
jgi:hypothetical protein